MNENQIKALRWEKDQVIGLGNGLSMRLRKSSKTYIVRKMINKKPQVITLGKSTELSLKQARIEAMQYSVDDKISTETVSGLVN